jgi:FkbM family methyltransferase
MAPASVNGSTCGIHDPLPWPAGYATVAAFNIVLESRMNEHPRRISFILASSKQGTLILNRLDYNGAGASQYGVGIQILNDGAYSENEIELTGKLLALRRHYFGDGAVAIDCGANIGIHTVEWARLMTGWGRVIAIEAQERVYYALAGNIAINNCFNATAINAAIAESNGILRIPTLDHQKPASFGSLELKKRHQTEAIGQPVAYDGDTGTDVRMITLDSLNLPRCDLIKIDVEGMEISVIAGAATTISRHTPIIMAESIKSNKEELRSTLSGMGYRVFEAGINFLAVHSADPLRNHVTPT